MVNADWLLPIGVFHVNWALCAKEGKMIHFMDIKTGEIYARSPAIRVENGQILPSSLGGLPPMFVHPSVLNPHLKYEDVDEDEEDEGVVCGEWEGVPSIEEKVKFLESAKEIAMEQLTEEEEKTRCWAIRAAQIIARNGC